MPGFLETPRVFVPGYAATVNGARGRIVRTPEGLVAVQVATGPQTVVLTYPGPTSLRIAFWFSVLGVILISLLSAWAWPRASAKISLSSLA